MILRYTAATFCIINYLDVTFDMFRIDLKPKIILLCLIDKLFYQN